MKYVQSFRTFVERLPLHADELPVVFRAHKRHANEHPERFTTRTYYTRSVSSTATETNRATVMQREKVPSRLDTDRTQYVRDLNAPPEDEGADPIVGQQSGKKTLSCSYVVINSNEPKRLIERMIDSTIP
ncbi:hypothetical protein ElyMa_005201400 [Elysia marginata]|uniref:Uncharacterized protein n=1 Tax=Elysia marginata TaxID=1093978 RepID=A0AAV4JUG1_9GAST|nr:hypothetical protein ElyMa_005201400 [Elysia marginata]